MINLTYKNSCPGKHIGGLLWLQGKLKGYSNESITGLMKISAMELGLSTDGKPAANNTTYAEDNNPWGMSCVKVRPTTQTGCRELKDGNTSGVYPSVWAGVADIFKWLDYNKIGDDVKKSNNPDTIIDFCESSNWMPNMSNYKKIDDARSLKFVNDGRDALLMRVGIFSVTAMFLLGIFLKKNSRAKFNAYRKKLGVIGSTMFGKAQTMRRRMTKKATSTTRRVVSAARRYYRRRKSK